MRYLKPVEWLWIALCIGFVVLSVWLDLTLPDFISDITREVQHESPDINNVMWYGGQMLLCALGSVAATIVVGFIAARVASRFCKELRSRIYSKVDEFGMAEINKFSTPSLITRSTNDVVQIQLVVTMGLQSAIKSPILAIWSMGKIATGGVEWTIATGIGIAVLICMFVVVLALAMPKFRRMQILTDNINRVARENLTGLSIVRAYNAENYQTDKFEQANQDLTSTQIFSARAMSFVMPTIATVMSALTLAIYWIGAYLINSAGPGNGALELFSNMVIFSSYTMQIILAIMMMTMWFIMLPRSQVSAKRVIEVLDTQVTIKNGTAIDGLSGLKGKVEFKNVEFKFSPTAEAVLDNISFEANSGETVAFIGSTGSGKSTLINMIPRFFDATSGEVLINGVNIKDYDLQALYNKMGYISQKSVMFDGTIRSNVAFGDIGNEMSDDDIYRGLEIAQGKEFVQNLEDGLESHVARGGANFSGGQKQRLSIARAIAKRPEFLIFDDSFSALDYKTDRNLRAAIKQHTADTTVLVVAQRIGTIMDADQIIVLDNGKMVGKGKHRELLQNCPVYLEIAKSQLSEEELAI